MGQQARIARLNAAADARAKGDPFAYAAEWTPTFTLDRQIAEARADMGEAEWLRLNAEFDATALSKEEL